MQHGCRKAIMIIRYTHCELSPTEESAPNKILFSEIPFEQKVPFFTNNIRITLPDGFFVCGHEKAIPNYRIESESKDLYFHWCANGKGTYNGIPFKKNDVFVCHPGTHKCMVADSSEPWEIFWCVWKGNAKNNVTGKLNRYESGMVYGLENDIDLSNLFEFLIYQPHRERRISKIINGFADVLLSDCHIMQKTNKSRENDPRAKIITEVQRYIDEHFLDTSVEKISKHFHYNRKYITRIFHEYTGMTMCEYIREVKLRHAESALLTSSLSVEEIAYHSGYSSYSSFIKAFKKKNNLTPTEFATLFR